MYSGSFCREFRGLKTRGDSVFVLDVASQISTFIPIIIVEFSRICCRVWIFYRCVNDKWIQCNSSIWKALISRRSEGFSSSKGGFELRKCYPTFYVIFYSHIIAILNNIYAVSKGYFRNFFPLSLESYTTSLLLRRKIESSHSSWRFTSNYRDDARN